MSNKNMKFYFWPSDGYCFKKQAVGNFVRTLTFDVEINSIHSTYVREVNKRWEQTVKNNIETDHRIKKLPKKKFQIYS